MPIQFRCSNCQKTLSISSKKAGAMIVCPACTEEIRVPSPAESPATAAESVKSARPAGGAYSTGSTGHHTSLFQEEDHESHDHDEDEEGHTPHPKKKRFMDDTVDMTAMVDVTFLLLIFFMVTASFAAQKVFEASPPEQEVESEESEGAVGVAEDVATESVIVEIDANDRMKIEDQTIASLFELREVLANKFSAEGKSELLIESEYEASHGIVVSVTDAAMDAGMQKIRRLSKKTE